MSYEMHGLPSRPKPSQHDFAALYEEWLLKLKTRDSESNNNYILALTARAGRMGTLQSALQSMSPEENGEFLRTLLDRMLLDQENEPDVPQPPDARLGTRNQHNLRATTVDVNVDAFFEEYPECIRPGWDREDENGDDDDEEESIMSELDEDKDKLSKESQHNTGPHFLHQKQQKIAINPYHQPNKQINAPSLKQQLHQQQQQQSFHQGTSLLPFSNNTLQPNSYASIISNTECWDAHLKDQNPFQTAREYAQASGDSYRAAQNQPQRQKQNPDGHDNPYTHQTSMATSENEMDVAAQGPTIRDSLKRKFQPPTKGSIAKSQSTKSSTTSGLAKRGLGSTASKQHKSSTRPSEDDANTDDDDLPEELKKYGKDLVEKIQQEIMDTGEKVTFADIAGLEDAKTTIQEMVCWPMKRPDIFTGLRATPKGLLLFGPPGTGKTLIGKAIAHESGATFFSISSSSLTSKWIGEGEKLVKTLFGVAGYYEPAVVFIDEIDSLLTQRKADENEASRRMKTEFLVQLDGTGGQKNVLTIGATNRPQELDEAARRRFVKRLYIPLPTESDRACLLNNLLEKNRHTLTAEEVSKLAADTSGFSGADLKCLCADAALGPIRQLGAKALEMVVEDLPPICAKHFRRSLRGMHPSVSSEDVVHYETFNETFGSRRAIEEDDDEDEN